MVNTDTSFDAIALINAQRQYFATGETRNISFRKKQLRRLREAILARENDILDALQKDLHKSAFEAYGTEIGLVLAELDTAIKNIDEWARPKKVPSPMFAFKANSAIHADPYGTVLIIAPWNYPFQLLMNPLVGAIAAGNTAVLKPSEIASHTAKVCTSIVESLWDKNYIVSVEGGPETSHALLENKFDYIFFTGGTEIGRIVYQAAAKHLTPVTLELGGKSPCIVDKDADIDLAAKRITWGKLINAGQTCIAPDYLLVHENVKDKLITAIDKHVKKFYGSNPQESKDYGRIINERHYHRLLTYLTDGKPVIGGQVNDSERYIAPTVLDNVDPNSKVMTDEIFGPILPIINISDMDDAIDFINARAKPLALYLFSGNSRSSRRVLNETSSGGVCINDTLMHMSNGELPFGGVGDSGIGAYHGQCSFDIFSHKKAVLKRSNIIDPPMRYAPYKMSVSTLRRLMKWTV